MYDEKTRLPEIELERCDRCGMCVEHCPTEAVAIRRRALSSFALRTAHTLRTARWSVLKTRLDVDSR